MKNISKILIASLMLVTTTSFANESSTTSDTNFSSVIMLLTFSIAFYFLLIRPQVKKNKEQKNMIAAIKVGEDIITTSGIFGKIEKIKTNFIELKIDDKVTIKIQKNAISHMLPKGSLIFNK